MVRNKHCPVCKECGNAEQKCWEVRLSSGNGKEEKQSRRGGKALRRKSICNLKLIKPVTCCNALILTQVPPEGGDRPNSYSRRKIPAVQHSQHKIAFGTSLYTGTFLVFWFMGTPRDLFMLVPH